jgi:hypothetical protein
MRYQGLAANETMMRYSRISAPFDGVVTMRYVDAGAFVPAATASSNPTADAIVTVMGYSTVRVRVAVPEIEAARVQVGQPVLVTTDSLAGKTFRGSITRHSSSVEAARGFSWDEVGRQCESDANLLSALSKVELTCCRIGRSEYQRFERSRHWFAAGI